MVESDVEKLTFRDIQARRDEVRAKLRSRAVAAGASGPVAESCARCPSSRRCRRWPSGSTPRSRARALERVDPLGFSALKTVVPAPDSFVGATCRVGDAAPASTSCFDFGAAGRILVHLSQAGRIDIEEPPKTTRGQGLGRAVPVLTDRTAAVLVREYGHERKAAWWVLAPGDDGPLERLGPEPDSDEFAELVLHGDDRRRVHTILRDQRTVSGVGRGYADDALWHAQLSPYATLASLDDDAARALLDAVREVIAAGSSASARRTGGLSEAEARRALRGAQPLRHAVPALR